MELQPSLESQLQTIIDNASSTPQEIITLLEHLVVKQYQKLTIPMQQQQQQIPLLISKTNFKEAIQNALQHNLFHEFCIHWMDSQFYLFFSSQVECTIDSVLLFATTQYRILETLSKTYHCSIPQQWFFLHYLCCKMIWFASAKEWFESIDTWLLDTIILFFSNCRDTNATSTAQWFVFPHVHPWDFLLFCLQQWKMRCKWNLIKKLIWFSKENAVLHPLLKHSFLNTFVSVPSTSATTTQEETVETIWMHQWLISYQKLVDEICQFVSSKQISATTNQISEEKQVLCLLSYWFDSFLLATEEEDNTTTTQMTRLNVDKLPLALQETLKSTYQIFGK